MLQHTGDKPYICDQCNKNSAQCSPLKDHMLLHIGDKPTVVTSVMNPYFRDEPDGAKLDSSLTPAMCVTSLLSKLAPAYTLPGLEGTLRARLAAEVAGSDRISPNVPMTLRFALVNKRAKPNGCTRRGARVSTAKKRKNKQTNPDQETSSQLPAAGRCVERGPRGRTAHARPQGFRP